MRMIQAMPGSQLSRNNHERSTQWTDEGLHPAALLLAGGQHVCGSSAQSLRSSWLDAQYSTYLEVRSTETTNEKSTRRARALNELLIGDPPPFTVVDRFRISPSPGRHVLRRSQTWALRFGTRVFVRRNQFSAFKQ